MDYDDLLARLRGPNPGYAEASAAAQAIEALQATLNDHLASESAETMRADKAQAELANLQVAFNDWKVFHSTTRLEVDLAAARTLLLKLKPYCPMGQGWKDAFDAAMKEKP